MSGSWLQGPRSCHGVVTSGAKRGGAGGDALRRAMHGGGGRWGNGWKGVAVTGCQRLWWRSWRWRCGVTGREKPSTPGNAGSWAAEGVVRRRKSWPSAVEVEISGLDVVDGRCGSMFGLWLASPAAGCPGRTTMTRSWSPSSAGMGMFGERAGGPCRGRGTECGRRQIRESRVCGVE